MIDLTALMKVLPIFVLAVISPGPDFMVVSSISLARGRVEGIKAAAGVASVICLYTFISLMGLSALFEHYLWMMIVIKICSGLYLLYLGGLLLRMSLAKIPSGQEVRPEITVSSRSSYWSGVLACSTNPKAIAFFASIFAIALTPDTSLATKLSIEFAIPATAFVWFSIVAIGLSAPLVRAHYDQWRRVIDVITGSVLAFLGIKLLMSADH